MSQQPALSAHLGRQAHLDEASVRLAAGHRLYGIAAPLTIGERSDEIATSLRALLIPGGRSFLHHYDEPWKRKVVIAEALATIPLDAAIIFTRSTTDRGQERARSRLLTELLPRLQHSEGVERVVIESRQAGDAHDVRVRDHLRRSRQISATLRIDHIGKHGGDPLVWMPDFIMGPISRLNTINRASPGTSSPMPTSSTS